MPRARPADDKKPPVSAKAKIERPPRREGSSLNRLLAVIDLFSLERPIWTGEEIGAELSLARATLYRYLQLLGSAGFVAPIGNGRYCLGPRIIELDRQIRLGDPLLVHATPVMERIIERFEGVLLLSTYYRDKVLGIHHVASDQSIRFSMQRGHPFPMFRSAPAKVILAHLPAHQLRSLFLYEHEMIRAAGLGDTWQVFRDTLKAIRTDGYFFAYGELDAELIGLSAPIFRAPGQIAGSLTTVMTKARFRHDMLPELTRMTLDAAGQINERVCLAPTADGSAVVSSGSGPCPPTPAPPPAAARPRRRP